MKKPYEISMKLAQCFTQWTAVSLCFMYTFLKCNKAPPFSALNRLEFPVSGIRQPNHSSFLLLDTDDTVSSCIFLNLNQTREVQLDLKHRQRGGHCHTRQGAFARQNNLNLVNL